jgi:hypothetical protein
MGIASVAACGDDSHVAMDEVGRQSRQPIELIPRPAIFDQNVAAIDETGFAQAQAECRHKIGPRLGRTSMEKPNHWHRGLLRARRERPPDRRSTEQGDERAAL